ncbi:SCO3374 family protein [Streptomyces galbus]|uniref:SCO3374 family protein n=1 Tax=Streptomyces galbus TaxID=33898 RepID=UPI003787D4F5
MTGAAPKTVTAIVPEAPRAPDAPQPPAATRGTPAPAATANPCVTPLIPGPLLPSPRRPLNPDERIRGWYENELGWATVPGAPVRLIAGRRFDVLDVPVAAGHAALRRLAPGTAPVAVRGRRMWLLVAAGSAEELPGVLRWLEWGGLPLDIAAVGAGGTIEAPLPPGPLRPLEPLEPLEPLGARLRGRRRDVGQGAGAQGPDPWGPGTGGPELPAPGSAQGAAVWLRPPGAGCEVEASLPTVSALPTGSTPGAAGGAPDLVRLVDTVATECHRVRLRCAGAQPLAFS